MPNFLHLPQFSHSQKSENCPKPAGNSSVHRLDPSREGGILRVGGRLNHADLPHETKHPSHSQAFMTCGFTLSRHCVKSFGSSKSIQQYIKWFQSVFCRRYHGKPNEQKMVDLPRDRISPVPPFTYMAVDYFGPFIIKDGHKEVKRYGALFTCLVSRAVHIEVASSLEWGSCILYWWLYYLLLRTRRYL